MHTPVLDRSTEYVQPTMTRRYRAFSNKQYEQRAAALLDQQLWCWGRDVVHPQGNVLLRLGMCHYRPMLPGRACSPSYTGELSSGGQITLWGFGVFLGKLGQGGVYIHRFGFTPLYTSQHQIVGVGSSEELPPLTPPASAEEWQRVRGLVVELASWIAHYEHWAVENLGLEYRRRCLAQRGQPPVVPAEKMASAWEQLAQRCRKLKDHSLPKSTWQRVLVQFRSRIELQSSSDLTRFRNSRRNLDI